MNEFKFFPQISSKATWIKIIIFVLLITFSVIYKEDIFKTIREWQIQSSNNELNVRGKVATDHIDIPLTPMMSFNGLSQKEILSLRRDSINRVPSLSTSSYTPSSYIFSSIVDGARWWSLEGQLLFMYKAHPGPERATDGLSAHSFTVLNPYMLVTINCQIPSCVEGIQTDEACKSLKEEMVQVPVKSEIDSPYTCWPSKLEYFPNEKRAKATLEFTNQLEIAKPLFKESLNLEGVSSTLIDINTINAQDFGYSFLSAMPNVEHQNNEFKIDPEKIYELSEYLHKGNSCNFPEGCNNLSGGISTYIGAAATPGSISFKLWRERPRNSSIKADFIYDVEIR